MAHGVVSLGYMMVTLIVYFICDSDAKCFKTKSDVQYYYVASQYYARGCGLLLQTV